MTTLSEWLMGNELGLTKLEFKGLEKSSWGGRENPVASFKWEWEIEYKGHKVEGEFRTGCGWISYSKQSYVMPSKATFTKCPQGMYVGWSDKLNEFCLYYTNTGYPLRPYGITKNIFSCDCRGNVKFDKALGISNGPSYHSSVMFMPTPPTTLDILGCILSDTRSVYPLVSFEDWCSEMDYDPDSRSAEQTYKQCREMGSKLVGLFGAGLLEELMALEY